MSEYWKSLPRKFCDACKCWFADNKVSIEFHERGKGHQDNVKRRLKEIKKKGQKQYEAQKNLEKDMKKIEEAALKAFQKDIESDPALAAEYEKEVARKAAQKKEEITKPVEVPKASTWFEAKSPEGHTYYWNAETEASTWKRPKNGFVSLAEQEVQEKKSNEDNETEAEPDLNIVGPQMKPDPYGSWAPVVKEEVPKFDLQLPKKPEGIEVSITLSSEKEKTKQFKEKLIGTLSEDSSYEVVFKKRKNVANTKRNVRKRTEDD